MKRILILTLLAIAAISCKKDDTLRYNNVTMGNIDGVTIISDQGNTFDIAESLYDVDLSSYKYGRIMFSCDVLKETSENRYDIRLTDITSVLAKPVINASSIVPDSEESVTDPVIIRELWYSGGYINMLLQFAHKYGSETLHLINLVYDDMTAAEEGQLKNYTFTLHHNASGEIPVEDTLHSYERRLGYVSFPISELIKEDKAKITLKWNAYPFEGWDYNYLERTEMVKTYEWERIGFEQKVPAATAPNLMPYKSLSVR